ncbi:hypothetical protein ACFR9U_02600 [Halorientalis brevis]|uniref:Uncharacterized protein n=1 Tax=Halorientalis brevis TaxID=1126241 RepID=A0ABD6C8Q7_9EURY|nr:hypothetical protein [Halorientalis brevis]
MKRQLLAVAVAAMLVLAGCNGGSPGGTATPDANNASANGSQDSLSDVSALPGVNESAGVYNATALWANHFESLYSNDTHFTEEMRVEMGSRVARIEYTNGSDGDAFVRTNETAGTSDEYWSSGSVVAKRNASATPPVTISQGSTPMSMSYSFSAAIFRIIPTATLSGVSLSRDGTTTLDGQEMYRFDIGRFNSSVSSSPLNTVQNATDASGTVLVTDDGIVRRADITATLESDGETQTATMNYSVSEIGTATAAQPDWAAAPRASLSTTADGNVLALELKDGSIPAGTEIEVGSRLTTYGTVTLSEELTAGETLYVVAGGQFSATTADAQIGEQPPIPEQPASFGSSSITLTTTVDGKELQYALPSN